MNNKLYKIEVIIAICTILVLLFVPKYSNVFLKSFDYSFTNFISVLIIMFTLKVEFMLGILFFSIYTYCIIQRRKNIEQELLRYDETDIKIVDGTKTNALIKIIRDEKIKEMEKEKLVLIALDSEISNINKLNIISIYINNCKNCSKVLLKLYNSDNYKLINATYVISKPSNKSVLIENIKKSKLNSDDREKLLANIALNTKKKVSFA